MDPSDMDVSALVGATHVKATLHQALGELEKEGRSFDAFVSDMRL